MLVTGGAGFVGSHLVERLLRRGDAVTVIDDLSTGSRPNLALAQSAAPGSGSLEFVHGRLSDTLSAWGRPAASFAEVYHLAAAVGVKLIMQRPVESIENNVAETAALFRWLTSGPGPKPVTLLASSSEVYGKGVKSPFSEDDDVLYGPTTVARWSYAASKALDEHMALACHTHAGVPVVVARLFNTVGPRQIGHYGMVLPTFVSAALAGTDLPVYGDGRQSRCFCDVRDVVIALTDLLAAPACHGRVFNVGSNQSITIADLAGLVCRVLGSASGIAPVPYREAYGEGYEDLRQRQPDLSRIAAAIGWSPRIDLPSTIRDLAAALTASPPDMKVSPASSALLSGGAHP